MKNLPLVSLDSFFKDDFDINKLLNKHSYFVIDDIKEYETLYNSYSSSFSKSFEKPECNKNDEVLFKKNSEFTGPVIIKQIIYFI